MLEELKTDRIAQLMLAALLILIGLACVLISLTTYTALAPRLTPPAQMAQQPTIVEPSPSPMLPITPEITVTSPPTPVTYELDWKIAEGQPIAYSTVMEVLSSTVSIDFDKAFPFTSPGEDNRFEEMVENMNEMQQTHSLVSILEKNPRGNISIKIVLDNVDLPEQKPGDLMGQEFSQLLSGLQGTVQLQGEVSPNGEITSFYAAQQQKNLIALFFQLPVTPVKIGDTWPIDLTCIAVNGAQFTIENSDSINQVKLTEITETPTGELVALLDYSIVESVEGKQTLPFASNEAVPSSMNCSFMGQGQFLIEQGRWQQFSAEYSIQTTGLMTSTVIQHLALSPLDPIPEKYLTTTTTPTLASTSEPPLTNTLPVLLETPTSEASDSLEEATNSGNETITGEGAVELGQCRFVSEAVVGPNEKVTFWSGSYIYTGPPGGPPLATESIAILDVLGVEAPETLVLHGKTYVRYPESEVFQSTLEPDPSRPAIPAVNLTLMSIEKDIEDPITLNLGGQEYPLKLDEVMDEFARSFAKEGQRCIYLPPEISKMAIEAMKNR